MGSPASVRHVVTRVALPPRLSSVDLDLKPLAREVQAIDIATQNYLRNLQLQLTDLQSQISALLGSATPIAIGGTPTAGVAVNASREDHVHPLTETAGPTNLSLGDLLDTEIPRRVGSVVQGATDLGNWTVNDVSTNSTTLSNWLTFAIPRSGFFSFHVTGWYRTAAVTTGLQLAAGFSGTASSARATALIFDQGGTGRHTVLSSTTLGTKLGVAGTGPGANDVAFFLFGRLNATSAGTLSLQFCSGVAASSVTIHDASVGVVKEF